MTTKVQAIKDLSLTSHLQAPTYRKNTEYFIYFIPER